jgi:hypothetical protein
MTAIYPLSPDTAFPEYMAFRGLWRPSTLSDRTCSDMVGELSIVLQYGLNKGTLKSLKLVYDSTSSCAKYF